MSAARIGVVLMTYGSARDAEDVPAYLSRIRGGRPAADDLIAEFQRRYRLIGGSPLIPITTRLAQAVEVALDGSGEIIVEAAMRFSEPTIPHVARRLAERGADRLVGLVLAPQFSPIIMGGYVTALDQAAAVLGRPAFTIGSWHDDPAFVALLADRVRAGLNAFPGATRDGVPVLMTAHSLPRRVVDREPEYIDKLYSTAQAVARAADLAGDRWQFAYQSAGHTPEEWLKPDMLDVLPELARAGHRSVLLAPVQFVADHLETLYDIDIGGQEQAAAAGIERLVRVPAPNDSPEFADVLAGVIRREIAAALP